MCKTKYTFTASIGINRISSCQVLIMTYWLSESVSISVDMAVCWSGVFSIHPHLRLERADKLQKNPSGDVSPRSTVPCLEKTNHSISAQIFSSSFQARWWTCMHTGVFKNQI